MMKQAVDAQEESAVGKETLSPKSAELSLSALCCCWTT